MSLRTALFFLLFGITSLSFCLCDINRHIECAVYSDSASEPNLSVIYITASSDQDKIHYLWSSYYLPSVIISRTSKDTVLQKIDFEKLRLFQSGAIEYNNKPQASTGFTISEIWQNSYDSDTADINEVKQTLPLNLESFHWKKLTNDSINCSKQFASIKLEATAKDEVFSTGGTFVIEFSVSGKEDSAADFPHLIYTGNSTQIKVIFDNFYSNTSRIRYALEMSVFAPTLQTCDLKECKTVVSKSVSDEFSPGIFSDVTLIPPCSHDSFLSWRPVSYLSTEPSVANSTDVQLSKCFELSDIKPQSIAALFFNDLKHSSYSIFNMTFGTKGDGFYTKTRYSSWSVMAGVGSSVGFKLSTPAIIFIGSALGALALFILCGLIFVAVQKCQKKDDELLLNTSNGSLN